MNLAAGLDEDEIKGGEEVVDATLNSLVQKRQSAAATTHRILNLAMSSPVKV